MSSILDKFQYWRSIPPIFLPRIFMAVKVSYVHKDMLICNSRSNATKNTPVLPYLLFSSLNF